ncbi:hypothetical protein F444_20972 [Phytophthora nicotianae P1976]|uniref:Uncharacterized protein n=1 Tax=Phytophthora nicotianae P1976 TaxID=1317066 RepID=A0A080Z2N7_PHYNI|nr:hypothetical protein F444_20972 [Phytophthora nicotianae P1976]
MGGGASSLPEGMPPAPRLACSRSYSYSFYLSGFFAKYSRPSDLERPRQVVEKQGTSPKKILMEEETSAGIALGGVKAKDKRHEHGLWGV